MLIVETIDAALLVMEVRRNACNGRYARFRKEPRQNYADDGERL